MSAELLDHNVSGGGDNARREILEVVEGMGDCVVGSGVSARITAGGSGRSTERRRVPVLRIAARMLVSYFPGTPFQANLGVADDTPRSDCWRCDRVFEVPNGLSVVGSDRLLLIRLNGSPGGNSFYDPPITLVCRDGVNRLLKRPVLSMLLCSPRHWDWTVAWTSELLRFSNTTVSNTTVSNTTASQFPCRRGSY